jgi:hypothetical protein
MTDENANNETYQQGFNILVGNLPDIKKIKPGNKDITEYYNDHLFVEKQEKTETVKDKPNGTTNNENLNEKNTEKDNKKNTEKGKIDPYYRIKQLETIANQKNGEEKERVIKIIKSLELLVEDPYDNFNIKNFVHEYQKVHDINDGEGHTPGKINRNETYTTDYYAMPYDGTDGVQHTEKHQNAYTKRGELIENVKALKNAGKKLKKDVGKSKLKPEHKKEIYNIIDANNKLILEYDSTKTKDELKEELKKVGDSKPNNSDNSEKSIQEIINKLPVNENNPKIILTTYDTKLDTVKNFYTNDYTTGSDKVAMNPQDESDYMYSVTYKSEDKGQKYADIFGIETIFRILRLTGSNIIPDEDNKEGENPKKEPYDVFTNYYKTDQKTKNPVYVSEYNKESIWNTNLLDEKKTK